MGHLTGRPAGAAVAAAAVLAATAAMAAGPAADAHAATVAGPAVAGTSAFGWGDNGNGELGDGTAGPVRDRPVPVKLRTGTSITSVRAGCDHTLALTSAGKVLAWGGNRSGQLGDGSTAQRTTPVHVKIPVGVRITAVRAGCDWSLALTSKGRLLAWGSNSFGQLGDGTTHARHKPVPVKLPVGTVITAISAGQVHGLAVTRSGAALAWGFGGVLGDGTDMMRVKPVPVALPGGTKVTAVAAGSLFSLAITRGGQVLAWGQNDSGQLGDGSKSARLSPVATDLPTGTKVTGLFAGCAHSLALTARGTVLAWGDNTFGQLGDGSFTPSPTPVQATMPPGTKVAAISSGCDTSMVRTASGRVLAWGRNDQGELGDGSQEAKRATPAAVQLPGGVKAIGLSAGSMAAFSIAIVQKVAR
jgi:alpha-tubulin suppressor-like RCC1 family protein